ncbi:MAG TPA: transposase [Cyclobacteriaceae bacterium]|nr:transposase [Cyclobacteriaceae bacterium]
MYFTTSTVVGWIDVFTRPALRQIVISSLRHCQRQKGLVVHGWCLMSNHLHMIISSRGEPLPGILRDFKKFTSIKIVEEIDRISESRREWMIRLFKEEGENLRRITSHKVWQDGNHPILLTKAKFTRQKLDYIHNNPVAEEIVGDPAHYLYSSARDYMGGKGYLEIDFIE